MYGGKISKPIEIPADLELHNSLYRISAIVSHEGASIDAGHYIASVSKEKLGAQVDKSKHTTAKKCAVVFDDVKKTTSKHENLITKATYRLGSEDKPSPEAVKAAASERLTMTVAQNQALLVSGDKELGKRKELLFLSDLKGKKSSPNKRSKNISADEESSDSEVKVLQTLKPRLRGGSGPHYRAGMKPNRGGIDLQPKRNRRAIDCSADESEADSDMAKALASSYMFSWFIVDDDKVHPAIPWAPEILGGKTKLEKTPLRQKSTTVSKLDRLQSLAAKAYMVFYQRV